MKTRIISGLIIAPLLILVLLGGPWIKGAVFVITIMGLYEFYRGFHSIDVHPSYPIAVVSICLLYFINIITYYFHPFSPGVTLFLYMMWFFVSVLMCLLYLFKIEERDLADAMATITGIVYIGFFAYHAVLAEDTFAVLCGVSPVWLILITAFGTDIFAYFGGYFLGKHKLCPNISPKKTIEGSICGTLASTLLCTGFGYLFMDREYMLAFVLVGLAGGIFSQFGDLTASIFKRKMGIKDYGHLIPGHGGIMDRFDSVIFTSPMIFYVLMFFFADKL
ncbi:MAG: phosphatidate cytidylyltransferase [Eubacteriales bacterium]|jgi:phosphatidate cytidylyltransferase|nr:phosphatidate cytidylyltransferase [Eubacteriales bacterium]